MTLTERKKRQIREMGHLTGLPVARIIRVQIDSLKLGKLKSGQWRNLTVEEVSELKGKTKVPHRKKSKSSQRKQN